MKNKWLIILLVAFLIKGLVWLFITPIFQVPDENVHFSLIQYIAENNRYPGARNADIVSREIVSVGKIVRFNWMISHPVWQGVESDWQMRIKTLDKRLKTQFGSFENQGGQKLPKAYFVLGAAVYKVIINQNFLWRFYALRFLSVILGLITVYLSYLIAQFFFKNKLLSLAAVSLIAFQPMASVIFSSITYDSLTILTATAFLYLAVKFIKTTKKKFQWLALFIALAGLMVKSQLIGLSLAWLFLLTKKQLKFLPLFLIIFIFLGWQMHDIQEFLLIFLAWFQGNNWHLVADYADVYAKPLLAEVFPWYWGVFGWLEKVMPLVVYRVIKIICGLSLIGIIISRQFRRIRFLLIFTFVMALVIMVNDFFIFSQRGANFGVQGRYFLPAVTAHMILLIFGLLVLIPKNYHNLLAKTLIVSSLCLNLIALWTNYQFFGWVW